ncbi:endospore germination permease [Paenibacillus puldeungensis]|uniref:Endospore germination permease n=1 Tax=Paenibacillus puldeungensis TaxID=696536 RepID=A0ABW3S2A9_9BACL
MKETITHGEARCIMILFIMGSTLILGSAGQAQTDKWISILLALCAAAPIVMIYGRLLDLYPGNDLFDIFEIVFGKWLGKLFVILYVWYALHLGALVLRNYGEFMNSVAMPETPMMVPMLFAGLLSIAAVKAGIETMGRSSRLLLNFCLLVIMLVALLSMGRLHFGNMLPILGKGWGRVMEGAFSTFSFPFAETVLLTCILSSVKGKKSRASVFFYALLFGGGIVLFIAFRNIFMLGEVALASNYFPSYIAVSRINVGDFIQRIEGTVAIVFVISVFVKMSVCLLAASKGLSKLFGLNSYRSVAMQSGLLLIYLAYFIYDNIMEMEYWATYIYMYYAFPFQVAIPVVLYIFAEVKVRRASRLKRAE